MDLGGWEEVFMGNVTHWLELNILEMLLLHGEAFQESQMLDEQDLI